MRTRTAAMVAAPVALTLAGLGVYQVAAAAGGPSELQRVHAATARFQSITQAEQAGYAEFRDKDQIACIAGSDGGMGIHYVNGQLLDDVVDPEVPEALVYAPRPNGSLELVAVEYIVFESELTGGTTEEILQPDDPRIPELFGVKMQRMPAGNRYDIPAFFERHLWLYEENSAGLLADYNPDVSCP